MSDKIKHDKFFQKALFLPTTLALLRGYQKEKITLAKKMKKEGIALEAIIKITKLPKEEIEKLK